MAHNQKSLRDPDNKSTLWRNWALTSNDSPAKAIVVTFIVCLFASVLVSGTAVLLRPKQLANKRLDQTWQISQILKDASQLNRGLANIRVSDLIARVVELKSGDYVEGADAADFDPDRAAKDPAAVVRIPKEQDVAGIKSHPKTAVVHLLMRNGRAELVVLPVYGRGFASTLYGYVGLTGDTDTVVGLAFYQHGETPGLGALIDNRNWQQLWIGKTVRGPQGEIALGVARGPVVAGTDEARFQVDGITGATWTGQGVTNLLRYWLGPHGFGPYLEKLRRASR